MTDSTDRYSSGDYGARHTDWHEQDASFKAREIEPYVRRAAATDRIDTVVDIGCGTGSVLAHLVQGEVFSGRSTVQAFGVEPGDVRQSALSASAGMTIHRCTIDQVDETFDLALLIDVLEHLDDPRAMLRHVARRSRLLVVRQPLLEGFGTFRHDHYRRQRDELGHINYWNTRSFDDLLRSTGWTEVHSDLVPPWVLLGGRHRRTPVHRLLATISPLYASILMSGFYRIGLYRTTVV